MTAPTDNHRRPRTRLRQGYGGQANTHFPAAGAHPAYAATSRSILALLQMPGLTGRAILAPTITLHRTDKQRAVRRRFLSPEVAHA
jgi:hypothetical protein